MNKLATQLTQDQTNTGAHAPARPLIAVRRSQGTGWWGTGLWRSGLSVALCGWWCATGNVGQLCVAQNQPSGDQGAVAATGPSQESTWTQWRGPQRTGIVQSDLLRGLKNLEGLKPKWRVPLAESYSGPIVAEGKVFVTETLNKKFEIVRALDLSTGQELWQHQWEGSLSVPFFAKANGDWIRSTPIYNDGRLYVGGIRDVLVCLNAADGKELWRIDFASKMNVSAPAFGNVPSPLIDGDYLYTQAGNRVVKIHKVTGEIAWSALEQKDDMMSGGAFSSPVIAELCGVRQLLVQTRLELAGVNLETGEVLWQQEIPTFRGMNILTPIAVGNRIFTSSYQGGTFFLEVSRQENAWKVTELWKNRMDGYMSTPVVIDNHVYMHLRNQRFACIDLATGQEKWVSKGFGKYWSLIAAGDRILALDETGELLLIAANPQEFQLLDRQKISKDSTWAHVGLVGREIFVRELKAMTVLAFE